MMMGVFAGFLFASIALNVYFIHRGNHPSGEIKTDTITRIDTLTYAQPVPIDSIVLRYKTVRLPVYKNKDSVSVGESLPADSTAVCIPITQKIYKDSSYTAWVSGYEAQLDSIHVYRQTVTISKMITRTKHRKWNVGLQAGYGYGLNSRAFEPYVGVGVNYSLW